MSSSFDEESDSSEALVSAARQPSTSGTTRTCSNSSTSRLAENVQEDMSSRTSYHGRQCQDSSPGLVNIQKTKRKRIANCAIKN